MKKLSVYELLEISPTKVESSSSLKYNVYKADKILMAR